MAAAKVTDHRNGAGNDPSTIKTEARRLCRTPACCGDKGMSGKDDIGTELNMLREIVRMLPASVTVQDENGNFLLMNDAAAR